MNIPLVFFAVVSVFSSLLLYSAMDFVYDNDNNNEIFLENSIKTIGADVPHKLGYQGKGITVGIIDTGIDYRHRDLSGFHQNSKVVGGYDFVDNDKDPFDTNGHGTQVAGIIAADGMLKGVAPKTKLYVYRVSSTGQSVSTELIVDAINRAVRDRVDIINISLGINKTNSEIDRAVDRAVKNGIFVVAAAGNNGPTNSTIGSPAKDQDVITVGASFNNVTSSLVATLQVEDKRYDVIPMLGSEAVQSPIRADLSFGEYGRKKDLENMNVQNDILIVERGSNVKGEIVYFSEKEFNAAEKGASAVIVYNDQPGIFLGELAHPNVTKGYKPRIPVLSMSREQGLELKQSLDKQTQGTLNLFYHPDYVALFSSRGPVSPFYMKPDLVAPGAFVNTTAPNDTYNFTSGTSFAAPHVTGAVALLLERDKHMDLSDIKSLLTTTTDPVTDQYGETFPLDIAGSGRINVTRALRADLIFDPHQVVLFLSPNQTTNSDTLRYKRITDSASDSPAGSPPLDYKFHWDHDKVAELEAKILDNKIKITSNLRDRDLINKTKTYSGFFVLTYSDVTYRIPIQVKTSAASILVTNDDNDDNLLELDIVHDKEWQFVKVSLVNDKQNYKKTVSLTPHSSNKVKVFENGTYWVEAQVTTKDGQVDNAYTVVTTKHASSYPMSISDIFEGIGLDSRHILIVSSIIGIAAFTAMLLKKRP